LHQQQHKQKLDRCVYLQAAPGYILSLDLFGSLQTGKEIKQGVLQELMKRLERDLYGNEWTIEDQEEEFLDCGEV
jgi:hypothetical protein